MNVRPYVLGAFALAAVVRPIQAQTTDERLTELEQLVQELRALHDVAIVVAVTGIVALYYLEILTCMLPEI